MKIITGHLATHLAPRSFLRLLPGAAMSGSVPLLRATVSGQTYLVGESIDNGDHVFSLTADKPVEDSSGKPVLTEFKTN